MKTYFSYLLGTVLIIVGLQYNYAQSNAREFSSMIDMRAAYLDKEMNDKGYKHVKTEKSGSSAYSFWWNARRDKCVSARVSDGRLVSVVNTPSADCDQGYSGGNGDSNRGVRWKDLKGRQALDAYASLEDRGFREVKEHKANGKTYRIWSHRRANLCIKTLSANKRIAEIMESDNCD